MSAIDAAAGLDFAEQNLSKKFGPEVVNYFSGSPLNRLSFLRSNTEFLGEALQASKILLFNELDPLSTAPEKLAYVTYADVAAVIGKPYELDEEACIAAHDSRVETPTLLFLGLHEADAASGFRFQDGKYAGQPYFAFDVTPRGAQAENLAALVDSVAAGERQFRKTRLNFKLSPGEGAIVAQARHIIHWNDRSVFCSACGARTLSVHAGTKRICPPTDRATAAGAERAPCVSRSGVHNITADPTVIMAIVNHTSDKILLGRQRRWPKSFYSCLAGFCEPAESVEEAVRREAWEETGVHVGRVVIHSSQPWPYPACLMLGAIAEALPDGEKIDLGNDPELDEADWYDIKFLREMLDKPHLGLDEKPNPGDLNEGDIRLPPPTAIAHQLLLAVAKNYHGGLKI